MPSRHPAEAAGRALASLDTPRVWSFIVTLFGDLAQAEDDHLDGFVLTRLTEALGIRPEAMRVALHRLRQEDWIRSIKSGRTARHTLTPHGRSLSIAASRVIYARPDEMPQDWIALLVASADKEMRASLVSAGFVPVMPRFFVGHAGLTPPAGAVLMAGRNAAPWLAEEACPPEVGEEFASLADRLHHVALALDAPPIASALDRAVLRGQVVHHWRRLVLRHPYLPPALTGPDWPAHRCRAAMTTVLDRLPRPSLVELAAEC